MWRLIAIMACVTLGCRSRASDAGTVGTLPAPSAPRDNTMTTGLRLTSVAPDSVRTGPNRLNELVIRGTGFLPAGRGLHDVLVGPITLTGVPANGAGTEIRITLPDRYVPAGGGQTLTLLPGTYDVVVRLADRTSNPVALRVIP
jgi:hypothetical protein